MKQRERLRSRPAAESESRPAGFELFHPGSSDHPPQDEAQRPTPAANGLGEPSFQHRLESIGITSEPAGPPLSVQRSSHPEGTAIAPDLGAHIRAEAGRGHPVEPEVQHRLEINLGADLSGVRLHTDAEADRLSRVVNAEAFTTGQDVFFRGGAYNPGSSEGLRLLAHEAAHTVQQARGPVAATPMPGGVSVSDPADAFEQAADRTAAQLVSSPAGRGSALATSPASSSGSPAAPSANGPTIQTDGKKHAAKFSPDISVHPNPIVLETGATVKVKTQVDNLAQARGMKIDIGGGTMNSKIVDIVDFERDPRHGTATHTLRGGRAGTTELGPTAVAENSESKTVWVPVTVWSDAARAAETLHAYSERREKGETIPDRDQVKAQNEAVAGAEKIAGQAKGSHGTEINAVVGSILDQISRIESARARGYLQAVGDLSAKGLDKEADYGAFGQALAGNLLWALSGVLPAAPFAALAIGGLGTFFKSKWTAPGPGWTAVVGTAGAMIAQFSAGMPSGSSSSALKIALETRLTGINALICNSLRRAAYEYLAGAVASSPPDPTTDAKQYAADLELGLRHALYGDVYAKGLNDGDQPNAGKIQQAARDQLLRQYVVANAAISGGDVVATKAMEGQTEVESAVDLLGGKTALKLEPHELVINQMRTAAADMGCQIDLDPKLAAKLLAQGTDIYARVTSYNSRELFGQGMPTKWFRMLTDEKIVKPQPEFDQEAYLGGVRSIDTVTVHQKDLTSAEIGGQRVYSAKYLYFSTQGSGQTEGDLSRSKCPPGSIFAIASRR